MSEFKVIAASLASASQQFGELEKEITAVGDALNGVTLNHGDFGHMPGQSGLYDGYQSHLEQSKQGISDSARGMSQIQGGLDKTRQGYEDMERAAQDAINKYFSGVGQ